MSTTTTYTGVRIVDMPDLGAVTDDSSVVGEHAGSGRFAATAFRTYVANAGAGNVGRNLLHNGLFNVQQRNRGPWTTGGYTADRWSLGANADVRSIDLQALTDADRAAIGDEAALTTLQSVFTGNAGAGAYTQLVQPIEFVQRLSGRTVTVSFWARYTSGSPRIGVGLTQVFGNGSNSPSASVSVAGQAVTISSTWSRYSVGLAVPSLAGKTVGNLGGDATLCAFYYSAGTGLSVPSGGIGVQSGAIQLWGIQLEIGSVATPLEKPEPRYDIGNCQRFYQTGNLFAAGYNTAGASLGYWQGLPVTMRAPPTVTPTYTTQTNCAAGIGGISVTGFQSTAVVTATGSCSAVGTFTASADL